MKMNTTRRPYTFDRVSRIVFSLLLGGAIIYLIILIKSALLPFLIAWLIAYLLNPMVGFFQYKLKFKNRVASILVTLLSVFAIFTLLTIMLIPSIVEEVDKAKETLTYYQNQGKTLPVIPQEWTNFFIHNVDIERYFSQMTSEEVSQLVQGIAPKIWGFLSDSINILMSFLTLFVILMYIIFILLDFDRISSGFIGLFPTRHRKLASQMLNDISSSMNKYFRGQALVAGIVGILYAIGFKIIDLPMGILMGVLMGFLNLVPYMQFIGLIPTETGQGFWVIFGLCLLVMAIAQGIEDLIIIPKVMGKVTGLNPAIILLSLSIWGSALGVIGLIIALPMTTLCLSYYRRYILKEKDEDFFYPISTDNE
jgi:predicted PurR-regulated permease PerM